MTARRERSWGPGAGRERWRVKEVQTSSWEIITGNAVSSKVVAMCRARGRRKSNQGDCFINFINVSSMNCVHETNNKMLKFKKSYKTFFKRSVNFLLFLDARIAEKFSSHQEPCKGRRNSLWSYQRRSCQTSGE